MFESATIGEIAPFKVHPTKNLAPMGSLFLGNFDVYFSSNLDLTLIEGYFLLTQENFLTLRAWVMPHDETSSLKKEWFFKIELRSIY